MGASSSGNIRKLVFHSIEAMALVGHGLRVVGWLALLVALLLTGPLLTLAFGNVSMRGDWRNATHRATGLAPDPLAINSNGCRSMIRDRSSSGFRLPSTDVPPVSPNWLRRIAGSKLLPTKSSWATGRE